MFEGGDRGRDDGAMADGAAAVMGELERTAIGDDRSDGLEII